MLTRTEHLLVILMEECAEIAQRASKAIRFGLSEVEPGQDKTNANRIMDEVNDFIGVYQMIAGPVVSPTSPLFRFPGGAEAFNSAFAVKRAKVEKFLAYAVECGTLGGLG